MDRNDAAAAALEGHLGEESSLDRAELRVLRQGYEDLANLYDNHTAPAVNGLLKNQHDLLTNQNILRDEIKSVDMTKYYLANLALAATATGLVAATGYLWRKVRKQDQHMEAVREFMSRLINETDCGEKAYLTFEIDDDAEELASS